MCHTVNTNFSITALCAKQKSKKQNSSAKSEQNDLAAQIAAIQALVHSQDATLKSEIKLVKSEYNIRLDEILQTHKSELFGKDQQITNLKAELKKVRKRVKPEFTWAGWFWEPIEYLFPGKSNKDKNKDPKSCQAATDPLKGTAASEPNPSNGAM